MEWIGCVHYKKSRRDFVARTFALIAPVHTVLHRVLCSYETIIDEPKHYETYQNMNLRSNGVDRVHLLEKFRCNFLARTFALVVQFVRFAPSFLQ